MHILALLFLGVMPALIILGGLWDLVTMKIPNWISGLLALGFVPAALIVGLPPQSAAAHLGVGILALVIGAAMFALRWIGGGDAKLMAAACLWLGPTGAMIFLPWTAVVGGAFCLALLLTRSWAQSFLPATSPGWVLRLMKPKGDIPYGVAIAAGALIAFPYSALGAASVAG